MTDAALAAEFDCLMRRAGIALPDDRRDGIFAAFIELRGQIALLYAPRSHLAEPSNIFVLPAPA